MLPEIGELVFSVVVGYMGALEFLFVVRHLYHWGFRHNPEFRDYKSEAESLRKLQDQLKNAIAEAKEREAMGLKAMKDGVMYKDGFRIDEDRKKIEELKEKVKIQEKIAERQREIEAELERQRKIEEETRKQLKKAEEELRRVEEEKIREKQKAEEEKRKAEEVKRKAEEEEKRKAESAKRKAEDEKRRAEEEENKRKQLAVEEENMKKILEAEKKREEEQRRQEEEIENERKLLQAQREREERQRELEQETERRRKEQEQRQQEEEEENYRKLLQAEKEREEKQRLLEIEAEKQKREDEENELKLLQAEKEREEKQRQQEIEDEKIVQKLLKVEREREIEDERQLQMKKQEQEQAAEKEMLDLVENEAALERENTARLIAAEKEAMLKQREQEENEENVRNLLKAERELEMKKREMEEEAANLQRLIEAEKEMEERQRKFDEEALRKLKNAQEETELRQPFDAKTEADEEVFVKKEISQAEQIAPQTVKTQYGQTSSEALKPKTLLFPGVSEESSSAEPVSSLQSSFSTQQSSEAVLPPELNFDEYERQAPDGGEDMPSLQYSDDYLRSLDGIKNKPLVREDGSGRRRAFKKRRSSGSSTSSRESRASREEELKMFTSLEEEEFENIRKGDSEYETIKYASEPSLKVGKQHRRHKRSPAKDAKRDPNEKGSLEMLNEEDSNPWGEVKPENYKNTDFWKREKNISIDEEQEEFDAKQRIQSPSTAAVNIPKMSSFEEATKSQHQEAILALQRQRSKDPEPIQEPDEESDTKNVSRVADDRLSPAGSNSSPASASASISPALQSPEPKREHSLEAEENKARTPSPSTGLRRSPRVDEMKEYEEKWKSEDRKARAGAGANPTIEVEYASDEEPMSPEHLMEGISDFYDFNASINPSRSRSRSRSKTPAVNRSVSLPERRTPSPLNCSHIPARSKSRSPSPDPASYKFIVQRIIPSLDSDQPQPPDHGLSDFYDFHIKLNREVLPGVSVRRSHEAHRTSVDYVLEDLRNQKIDDSEAIAKNIEEPTSSPTTPEYDRTISAEMRDIQKLKEEIISGNFKRSTYVGESMDFSDEFESLREEAKTFRRSRSRSRSPVYDDVNEVTARILAKKQLQAQILEDITKSSENSKQFSVEITKNIVDRNRRASDTALIQKPEILFQIQDLIEETDENFNILNCEPEEYHHFRRFSLGQEIPVEQYPEDYAYVSEIEIKSLVDLKNVTINREDLGTLQKEHQIVREEVVEEAYESGSDDERQTVVEVDDEIDEDIWEYNEKPADESHNEQSECEEADREMDRYAGRNADDWRDVEGAVGGVSDEDSFQIDQIYDEAIKNRKPSGILRDYDCILKEIQVSDEDRLEEEILLEKATFSNGNTMSSLEPGLWSPQSRSSRASSRDSSRSLIEYERRDTEMRYLADPTMSAINSTRLRSRYGIVPSTSLPTGFEDEDVDVNYVPKKEYNWRKNFKLDDDSDVHTNQNSTQYLDSRKFSLGGESITLFSQSPENTAEDSYFKGISLTSEEAQLEERIEQESEEKPSKKKKNKRKSRKGSKGSIGEEKESLLRQINLNTDDDSTTKKKHRRESKKDEKEILPASAGQEVASSQQEEETESSQTKKKSKKHRKAKDEIVLPKLDIVIPTPEKKAPPPSVAALRAALSAPPPSPPEKKSPLPAVKPKKLWETQPAIINKESESKPIPSSVRSSISPQPAKIVQPSSPSMRSSGSPQPTPMPAAKENGVGEVLPSKTLEFTDSSIKSDEISHIETSVSTLRSPDWTLNKEEKKTVETEVTKNSEPLESASNSNANSKIDQSENDANIVSKAIQNENQNEYLEANKSELPNLQPISEPSADSTQNPTLSSKTDQNTEKVHSLMGANNQKPALDSDILKDGGLYPLF